MFTSLRRFTVIFLAILQLIAPLVHAHVGENVSPAALHVPGLEKYSFDRDLSAAGQKMLRAGAIHHDLDCMLIGIDTGIKNKPFKAHADSDYQYYLHQQTSLFKTEVSVVTPHQSQQAQPPVRRLLASSLSPRAPPAQ